MIGVPPSNFNALSCTVVTPLTLDFSLTVMFWRLHIVCRREVDSLEIQSAQTDGWNAVKTTEDDFISLPPKLLI